MHIFFICIFTTPTKLKNIQLFTCNIFFRHRFKLYLLNCLISTKNQTLTQKFKRLPWRHWGTVFITQFCTHNSNHGKCEGNLLCVKVVCSWVGVFVCAKKCNHQKLLRFFEGFRFGDFMIRILCVFLLKIFNLERSPEFISKFSFI
jgi:hypothetical protein